MVNLFGSIKKKFQPKFNATCIDNWVFKLHYRVTTIFFLIAIILVTFREYVGEHIKCITDLHGLEKVIETFCFFGVTEDADLYLYSLGYITPRRVLPYGEDSQKAIRKHIYYQWIPFVLFGQAIMFYLTHHFWKKLESNRIRKLVADLAYSRFALLNEEVEVGACTISSKEKKEACIKRIKNAFLQRIALNKSWARWFVFFEILNVVHVGFQFYITNKLLGNQFNSLGRNLLINGSRTLDEVFPKVTKCAFYKFGPSGSIQIHDILCVMAINIINEKIYVFLWFWFIALFTVSCLIVVWRFLTMLLYSRSIMFNRFIFGHPGNVYSWHIQMVTKYCDYMDWLLLKYLAKNMDSMSFKEIFVTISEDLEESKPLFMPQNERISNIKMNKFD